MNIFADLSTNEFFREAFLSHEGLPEPDPSPRRVPAPEVEEIRSDPTPEPPPQKVVMYRCRECGRYDVDHGVHWCEQPSGWLSIVRLFRCPGRDVVAGLTGLQSTSDPYSRIFIAACESLPDRYPPGMMDGLRAESPEQADKIDSAYEEINARWGGDLDRFQEGVTGWTALLRGGSSPVWNCHTRESGYCEIITHRGLKNLKTNDGQRPLAW